MIDDEILTELTRIAERRAGAMGCVVFASLCALILLTAFLIGSQLKDIQQRVGQLEQQVRRLEDRKL